MKRIKSLSGNGYISVRRKLVEGDENLPESKKAMAQKLRQDNAAMYRRRKAVVEPVTAKSNAARDSQRFKCVA